MVDNIVSAAQGQPSSMSSGWYRVLPSSEFDTEQACLPRRCTHATWAVVASRSAAVALGRRAIRRAEEWRFDSKFEAVLLSSEITDVHMRLSRRCANATWLAARLLSPSAAALFGGPMSGALRPSASSKDMRA